MPLLQIEENIVAEPKDFTWGKGWRAVRIWKELKDDGEWFFALVIKKYGPGDYGTKKDEEYWIGREVKFIGERDFDVDPKSPTFGHRITKEPTYAAQEVWDEKKRAYVEQKYAIEAKKIYVYKHKASPEMSKKYKTLAGDLPGGTKTQLIFLYGSRPVNVRNQNDFWIHTVEDFAAIEEKSDSIFDKKEDKLKRGKAD